jgi:hypothetical protein
MEAAGRKVHRDPDGRPSIRIMGFRLAATFELSQTDSVPGFEHLEFVVPTIETRRRARAAGGRQPELLTGEDPTGAYDEIVTLIEAEGYRYGFGTPGVTRYLPAGYNAVTVGGRVRRVIVSDQLAPAQRIKTAIHELAHIRCDHLSGARPGEDLHRGRKETEAESVAHIVCLALGLDSRRYSDAYVLAWANGDLGLIKAAMETVTHVARSILSDLTPADATPDRDGEITEEIAA